ncbi:MAG: rhomboid family intramembrane serine protease [Alphaproteobacteria bacterium]|nr:rhomboid family intramembrane serine protease [Alphaproteobacteria bacterium]
MFPVRTSIPNRDIPAVVIALIVANIAIFIVQSGLTGTEASRFLYNYGLVPALIVDFWSDPLLALPILSSTFLHGGVIHLAVNMWTLWLFGPALEARFGALRFTAFYFLCGALASLTHLLFNLGSDIPAVGASGAIAGVLGGFTLLHPKARVTLLFPVLIFPLLFPLPAAIYTALWFAFQIIPGIMELGTTQSTTGIAWWAHIGGLIAGIIFARLFVDVRVEKHIKSGRLDISVQAGHRPRTIAFGEFRDDALNSGVQRPTVIRLGSPRKKQVSRATSLIKRISKTIPDEILLADEAIPDSEPQRQQSSTPTTDPKSLGPWSRAPADAEPPESSTEDVWKSLRRV